MTEKSHSIAEQFESVRWYIDRALKADYPLTHYASAMKALQDIQEQYQDSQESLEQAVNSMNELAAELVKSEEQFEAALVLLSKTYGELAHQMSTELLTEYCESQLRSHQVAYPSSGERVAAGEPSSTSPLSGANQSPETSSPASSLVREDESK